jgi:putative tricarboxylic transport membrane protein
MKKAEMVASVILLALSGAAIWEALEMPPSASFGPGAGFLPFWLGVLLAALATIMFVSACRRQPTGKDGASVLPGKHALLTVTSVMVGLTGYILLIEVLGYLVDTFLFVVFLMKVSQRERWLLTLEVALATTFGLFIIFQMLLRITLPSNMFGF